MHHVPLAFFNVYMDAVKEEVETGTGRRGESGDYLASCMQMTWFCVVAIRSKRRVCWKEVGVTRKAKEQIC